MTHEQEIEAAENAAFAEGYEDGIAEGRYLAERERLEDLLWSARTTGEPDLFGPELRGFWDSTWDGR